MVQTVIAGKHAHYLTGGSYGFTYKQEHWIFQRAGIITNYNECRAMVLTRCKVDGSQSHEQCWGIRAYDVSELEVAGCEFVDIVAPHPTKPINLGEHGIYVNVIGNVLVRNSTFRNIAGQAVQTVFLGRTKESSNYEAFKDNPGTLTVRACTIENVGLANPNHTPGGRASFPLSFFASAQDVVVERCSIKNVGGDWWSKNPTLPTAPRFVAYGGIMAHGHPNVRLLNNTVELEAPDRELVQIRNCANVEINGGTYIAHGGNGPKIAIEGAKKIRVSGVKGNAALRIDGKLVGLASAGYSKG